MSKARLPTKAKLATREKLAGEIKPVSAENSHTSNDDKAEYGAAYAFDLDLSTRTSVAPGSDGKSRLKVHFGKVYRVKQVIRFHSNGERRFTWTCSKTDCSACKKICDFMCSCETYTLSVESVEATPNNLKPDCKYGDTVSLEHNDGNTFVVWDMAITVKGTYIHKHIIV